jgi:RNA polymerase sigma-70 factor (ECF subfamily)
MDQFRELYERYYADVYRFALFLTGEVARAEDLTADTFVRAWTARDRIRQSTVRAYLLTITRNLFRDGLRTSRPQVPLDERLADHSPTIEVRVERAAALRQVRARLRRVARGDRRALLLYVIRDMSYAEIAVTLGVSVAAVKSRIFRAHEALGAPASPRNGESS